MIKYIICLLFPITVFAQNTDCVYEINQKTDSTSVKSLGAKLMHEKVLGSTSEFLFFNLLQLNGKPVLQIEIIQNSTDFVPTICLDEKSRINLQLYNGKIVTLKSLNESSCSEKVANQEKITTRVLSGYFTFLDDNYEDLKSNTVSMLRLTLATEIKSYVLNKLLISETLLETTKPESYFKDFLSCVEF